MNARYSEPELAKRWGVTPRTLRAWRNKGIGPQFITVGIVNVLYREEDVLAYENRRVAGGEIPVRAVVTIKKAANSLDIISRWNISEQTQATIISLRDELRGMVAKPVAEAS